MEKEYATEFRMSRRNGMAGIIGFGTLIILTGVALLGFNLGWFPAVYKPIVISWQALAIAIGIISFFQRHFIVGTFFTVTGIVYLLPKVWNAFPEVFGTVPLSYKETLPILLIGLGIIWFVEFLVRRPKRRDRKRCYQSTDYARSDSDYVNIDIMFNGSEQIVFSEDFNGGDVNVGFGEMKLDLRKVAELNPENYLTVNNMFGNTVIYIPEGWYINMKNSGSVFGTIVDKRTSKNNMGENNSPEIDKAKILNLKCSTLFGTIEFMN